MLHFLCCLLFAQSYSQLTSLSSTNSEDSFDIIELTIIAHRNELGQYVVEWRLTDSSGSPSVNATLNVTTDLSESDGQISLKLGGIYKVTDLLRPILPPEVETDLLEIDVPTTVKFQEITTVPTKAVPRDYEYFPGVGHYKFYPEAGKSYNEAEKICSNDGAHLAIINSLEEKQSLMNIFARQPASFSYANLGFHYKSEEGRFVTIFGDAFTETGYTNWCRGEPHKISGVDCGAIARDGCLVDVRCTGGSDLGFLCEI